MIFLSTVTNDDFGNYESVKRRKGQTNSTKSFKRSGQIRWVDCKVLSREWIVEAVVAFNTWNVVLVSLPGDVRDQILRRSTISRLHLSATASFPLPATISASSSLFTSFVSPSLLEEAASWRIDLQSSDIGFPIPCRWMQCGFDRGASDCPNLRLITGAEMVRLAS
ncbi:hypothetical protein SDJN02_19973, partial [Cucurbita argyrosperma subsp. argyrosperma]